MTRQALLALLCGLLFGCAPDRPATSRPPSVYVVRKAPITITMYQGGGGLTSGDWNLSVNSAGQAQLTVFSQPADKSVEFSVSPEKLNELRELLVRERFFELQNDYGEIVPDGGTQAITITIGASSKTVRLNYLMNWVTQEPAKLREPARAIRIGVLIRDWFDDSDAVDSRGYDQKVLDALK